MEVGDFWCCLAEALDAEELDSYQSYLLAGGEKKKWKWQTPDHAGTRPPLDANRNRNVFSKLLGVAGAMGAHRGTMEGYAEATHAPRIYRNPDGSLVDAQGAPITPPPGFVFVELKKRDAGNN